jgi:hypothetical protein
MELLRTTVLKEVYHRLHAYLFSPVTEFAEKIHRPMTFL